MGQCWPKKEFHSRSLCGSGSKLGSVHEPLSQKNKGRNTVPNLHMLRAYTNKKGMVQITATDLDLCTVIIFMWQLLFSEAPPTEDSLPSWMFVPISNGSPAGARKLLLSGFWWIPPILLLNSWSTKGEDRCHMLHWILWVYFWLPFSWVIRPRRKEVPSTRSSSHGAEWDQFRIFFCCCFWDPSAFL